MMTTGCAAAAPAVDIRVFGVALDPSHGCLDSLMDLTLAGQFVLVMLSPTLAFAAAIYLPRAGRAVWQRLSPAPEPTPTVLPIERITADLHRLLHQHHALRHGADPTLRFRRLQAVEAAITDRALEAARALEVPAPAAPGRFGLRPPVLSKLLRDLADAGLVLPRGVDLLDGDRS
jgi:hypothetical protein